MQPVAAGQVIDRVHRSSSSYKQGFPYQALAILHSSGKACGVHLQQRWITPPALFAALCTVRNQEENNPLVPHSFCPIKRRMAPFVLGIKVRAMRD
jgi:hypothetical protein